MEIYKKEQRFNSRTGKPAGTIKVCKETRCDFSGRVVDGGERKDYPAYYCKLVLDYENQDPCFGASGDEFRFGKDNNLNMFDFLSQPYVIFDDVAETGETEMPAFLKSLADYESLDHALRTMRINTAKKLLADGIIKPEDLRYD